MSDYATVEKPLSWESDWVQRNTGRTLTEDEARCVDTLSAIQRPYNWVLIGGGWRDTVSSKDDRAHLYDYDGPPRHPAVTFGGRYLVVRLTQGLATFDFDDLTRLVLAAHRNAVRVEVSPDIYGAVSDEQPDDIYPMPCLRVSLHARHREGSGVERHPTIEQAMASHIDSTPAASDG